MNSIATDEAKVFPDQVWGFRDASVLDSRRWTRKRAKQFPDHLLQQASNSLHRSSGSHPLLLTQLSFFVMIHLFEVLSEGILVVRESSSSHEMRKSPSQEPLTRLTSDNDCKMQGCSMMCRRKSSRIGSGDQNQGWLKRDSKWDRRHRSHCWTEPSKGLPVRRPTSYLVVCSSRFGASSSTRSNAAAKQHTKLRATLFTIVTLPCFSTRRLFCYCRFVHTLSCKSRRPYVACGASLTPVVLSKTCAIRISTARSLRRFDPPRSPSRVPLATSSTICITAPQKTSSSSLDWSNPKSAEELISEEEASQANGTNRRLITQTGPHTFHERCLDTNTDFGPQTSDRPFGNTMRWTPYDFEHAQGTLQHIRCSSADSQGHKRSSGCCPLWSFIHLTRDDRASPIASPSLSKLPSSLISVPTFSGTLSNNCDIAFELRRYHSGSLRTHQWLGWRDAARDRRKRMAANQLLRSLRLHRHATAAPVSHRVLGYHADGQRFKSRRFPKQGLYARPRRRCALPPREMRLSNTRRPQCPKVRYSPPDTQGASFRSLAPRQSWQATPGVDTISSHWNGARPPSRWASPPCLQDCHSSGQILRHMGRNHLLIPTSSHAGEYRSWAIYSGTRNGYRWLHVDKQSPYRIHCTVQLNLSCRQLFPPCLDPWCSSSIPPFCASITPSANRKKAHVGLTSHVLPSKNITLWPTHPRIWTSKSVLRRLSWSSGVLPRLSHAIKMFLRAALDDTAGSKVMSPALGGGRSGHRTGPELVGGSDRTKGRNVRCHHRTRSGGEASIPTITLRWRGIRLPTWGRQEIGSSSYKLCQSSGQMRCPDKSSAWGWRWLRIGRSTIWADQRLRQCNARKNFILPAVISIRTANFRHIT